MASAAGAAPGPPQDDAHAIYDRYVAGQPVTAIDRTVGTAVSRTDVLPVLYERGPKRSHGTARPTQVVTKTQGGQPPWIVNSGTYRSGIDVIAIGLHAHFRGVVRANLQGRGV